MFTTMWQNKNDDSGFLEQIVEKWRHSASGGVDSNQTAMFADAMGLTTPVAEPPATPRAPAPPADPSARRYPTPQAPASDASTRPRWPAEAPQGTAPAPTSAPPAAPAPVQGSSALRSLRDRLNQRGGQR
jgi:hypothetical protein